MTNALPFFLQTNEKLIKEERFVNYKGMKLWSSISLLGGIIHGLGTKKVEGGFFDVKLAHIYLTNQRFIVAAATTNYFQTKETVGSILCDIPNQSIMSIIPNARWEMQLSYKISSGEIERITIGFQNVSKRNNEAEIAKWIELTKKQLEEAQSSSPACPTIDDPKSVAKMRYAKGEITKEEYLEIIRILEPDKH